MTLKRFAGITAITLVGCLAAVIVPPLIREAAIREAVANNAPSPSESPSGARQTLPIVKAEISLSSYMSLKTGMTYGQVTSILGSPGEEMSSSDIAGFHTVMYMWRGDDVANMNAIFQNGKLIQKAQFGLK